MGTDGGTEIDRRRQLLVRGPNPAGERGSGGAGEPRESRTAFTGSLVMNRLVILCQRPHQREAELLSGAIGIPLARSVPVGGVAIAFGPHGMELVTHRDKVGQGVGLDVEWIRRELSGSARALRSDPLVRAVGGAPRSVIGQAAAEEGASSLDPGVGGTSTRERPLVVDATAGFCNDAFHLAAVGYRVVAIERQPAIHAVISSRVAALLEDPLLGVTARRIETRCGDARRELPRLAELPEIILLDPMFPPKRKRSALPPKPIQVLRLLAGDDEDAADLLEVARKVATRRVVVKRADDAPPLGQLWPDWSIRGKTVRYDVYAGPETGPRPDVVRDHERGSRSSPEGGSPDS